MATWSGINGIELIIFRITVFYALTRNLVSYHILSSSSLIRLFSPVVVIIDIE
jgi:hypothetical protein